MLERCALKTMVNTQRFICRFTRSLFCSLLVCGPLVSLAEDNSPSAPTPPPQDVAATTPPTIQSISVVVREIFEGEDLPWVYSSANKLKMSTREEVIRRELLFKVGDPVDQFTIDETVRILRRFPFIRNVEVNSAPVGNGNEVAITLSVQDTWTFLPQLNYSSGSGTTKQSMGIVESNIGGFGKRGELLYEKEDQRNSVQAVLEDPRVLGTFHRLLLAHFDRSDGRRSILEIGRPLRTVLEREAWNFRADVGDTIGRLFRNGDERFIFGQEKTDFSGRYSILRGEPEIAVYRYMFGYDYSHHHFTQAELSDFEDLEIDPTTINNDPALVPENRRFSGPALGIQKIDPDFISLAYIDRFDRVQDYNLGDEYSFNLSFFPTFLGSDEGAVAASANRNRGLRLSGTSFLRGEIGASTRVTDDSFENNLLRAEARWYDVLGEVTLGGLFVGKHTLAANVMADYGDNLDLDREFLLGADSGLRGYDARTFTGDKRFVLNVEDRVHLVEDLFSLVSMGAAVFADVGGTTEKHFGEIFSHNLYGDVGIGLRFAFPRSSGGQVLRLDVSFPVRSGPDGANEWEPRILVAGGQIFGSSLRSESFGPEKANISVGVSD